MGLFFVLILWLFVGVSDVSAQTCSGTAAIAVEGGCNYIDPTGQCNQTPSTIFASCTPMYGGCYAEFAGLACEPAFPGSTQCVTVSKGYTVPCGASGGSCLDTAPACGGTCPSGTYCRAKTSDPSQCVCAESGGTGCNGGYLYECRSSCTGYWDPGGSLSCPTGEVSCRSCCTLDYPDAPTLISPADGSILSTGIVNLMYSPPFDWGGNCDSLPNPTSILMMGISPSNMTEIARVQEARATSAAIVGSNIEISGIGFGSTGDEVQVRLAYQSSPTTVSGTPQQLIRGYAMSPDGYWGEPGEEDVWMTSYCQSMTGRPNWDGDTGIAWFSSMEGNSGGLNEYYYTDNWLCVTYGWPSEPTAMIHYPYEGRIDNCSPCGSNTITDCDKCGRRNYYPFACRSCEECKSCDAPNTAYYNATIAYTQERVHVGVYSVQSDGKIRIPLSSLPTGGISGSLGITAGVTRNVDGFNLNLNPGTYYWKVVADNGAEIIGAEEGTQTTESPTWSFTINLGVSGTVYYDPDNTCSTSTPTGLTGGMDVTYEDSVGGSWTENIPSIGTSTGQFSIDSGTSNGTLTLNSIPAGYSCSTSCGGGCPTKTGVVGPSQNNNFFITDRRGAWWQAQGSSVYAGSQAGGITVQSLIPPTVPSAERYLIIPGSYPVGALLRASGSVALQAGSLNASNLSAVSAYKGKRTDYKFFAKQLGVTFNQSEDFASDSITKPSYDSSKVFWYSEPETTTSIDSAWNVANGESYVVLVNGDLLINSNINVESGGFLAFIVASDITIAPSVTNVEGLLLSGERFITQTAGLTSDTQLTIEGSVVAWGGLSLLRDMGITNLSEPAERFVYRSDIVSAMPDSMKVHLMQWQEIPAGSLE